MVPTAAREHKPIYVCEMMERLGIYPGGCVVSCRAAPEPKLSDRISSMR